MTWLSSEHHGRFSCCLHQMAQTDKSGWLLLPLFACQRPIVPSSSAVHSEYNLCVDILAFFFIWCCLLDEFLRPSPTDRLDCCSITIGSCTLSS